MNKEELANKVFDSIEKNMKENKINIYSAYESLLDSLNTKTDIAEPLLEFYLSAIKHGATAAIQTLVDLKIVKISE